MIAIETWRDLRDTLNNRYNTKEKTYICILFINPNSGYDTPIQIVNNLKYLHNRSGEHIDFFIPGIKGQSFDFINEFNEHFDHGLYVKFIEFLEKRTEWKYYGGTQLVVLKYFEGFFETNSVLDINLDKLRNYCDEGVINNFFEGLISKVKESNGNDNFQVFASQWQRYAFTEYGFNLFLDFINRDFISMIETFRNTKKIKELFKIKNLSKIPPHKF